MIRIDGQGHHPWIRPHIPHRKKERAKLKATKSVLPKWKLAMMKLRMNFIAQEDGRIKLCRLTESDILETSETMMEEPICLDMSCGEVGNYAMLEAAPSRPPPKHGWAHRVIQYAAVLFFAALTAFATACHKDPTPTPQPTPDQPTDTVTPVVPTREIVIHWDWDADIGWAPPKDSIRYYTDQADVRIVDINLIGFDGIGFPVNCTGFYASTFHKARDTLQTRIDIDPSKVKLSGTILINFQNGATITSPDNDYDPGITPPDSAWFASNGCIVRRPPHGK